MSLAVCLSHLTIELSHQVLLNDASASATYGGRIGIIGPNGAGKSTLLKIIAGEQEPTAGAVDTAGLRVRLLGQQVQQLDQLSGAEGFEKAFTEVIADAPDILLLDEPTNHLDHKRRQRLQRLIENYYGTVIIASHDESFLEETVDVLWVVEQKTLSVFPGRFSEYWATRQALVERISDEKQKLKQAQKVQHTKRMKAQEKASRSAARGKKSIQQRKWPTIVSTTKLSRGTQTSDKASAALSAKANALHEQLEAIKVPELPIPRFSLTSKLPAKQHLIDVREGSVAIGDHCLIEQLSWQVAYGDRVGIFADNATGKTTLFKALMNAPEVQRKGQWRTLKQSEIGWLDQHYTLVSHEVSPLSAIEQRRPDWSMTACRRHLCDFLFESTAAVSQPISVLSGGEKARLALACIAALTPPILLLDEVTNNIDWWTRQHIIQVLSAYPGTLITISHEASFLASLKLDRVFSIESKRLIELVEFNKKAILP